MGRDSKYMISDRTKMSFTRGILIMIGGYLFLSKSGGIESKQWELRTLIIALISVGVGYFFSLILAEAISRTFSLQEV